MIILNDYSVSADGKWLTLDVVANPSLTGVYLKSIRISCTGDFTESDSSAATFDTLIGDANNEYTEGEPAPIVWDENLKKVRIKLDVDMLRNKPYYLCVIAADPEHTVTTCAHRNVLEAITFDKYPLYQNVACLAHEMEGCNPPQNFMDYLLRLKALEANIVMDDVESINYYFDLLFSRSNKNSVNPVKSGCGCH